MVREARAAYRRRDEELAQRKNAADGTRPGSGTHRGERDWWDRERGGGPSEYPQMTPVAEEVGNPIEDIIISDDEREVDNNEATLKRLRTVAFHEGSEAAAPMKSVSFDSAAAVSST